MHSPSLPQRHFLLFPFRCPLRLLRLDPEASALARDVAGEEVGSVRSCGAPAKTRVGSASAARATAADIARLAKGPRVERSVRSCGARASTRTGSASKVRATAADTARLAGRRAASFG